MKKLLLISCLVGFTMYSFSQVAISSSGGTPDSTAMLDISSTTKGLLPPRMTSAERNAIAGPAEGLRIYNTDTHCENFYNGTTWQELCGSTIAPPFACGASITDVDGETYGTVQIGTQCWTTKNLNTSTHTNGNSYCYNNVPSNCDTYGRLYDWAATMEGASQSSADPSGVQGICPSGWHVPSDAEWCVLETFIGVSNPCSGGGNWRGDGENLKSGIGFGGNNGTGFSAIPAGRLQGSSFGDITTTAVFWSTTESGGEVWRRQLITSMSSIGRWTTDKTNGLSVRCVLDY